jgi:hypothetical protein
LGKLDWFHQAFPTIFVASGLHIGPFHLLGKGFSQAFYWVKMHKDENAKDVSRHIDVHL